MLLLSDYPFLDVMWTMLVFFLWIAWFWLLFNVWTDIFRRHDLSGVGKTGWLIFTVVLPFLGVFIYVISQNDRAKQLLDSGAINQTEFDALKQKALAG